MRGVVKLEPIENIMEFNDVIYEGRIYRVTSYDRSHAICAIVDMSNKMGIVNPRVLKQLVIEYDNPDCESEGYCQACDSKTNDRREPCTYSVPLHPSDWAWSLEYLEKEVEYFTSHSKPGHACVVRHDNYQNRVTKNIQRYADQLQGRTPALSICTCGKKMYTVEETWNLVNDAFNKGRIGFPYHIFYNRWREEHKQII